MLRLEDIDLMNLEEFYNEKGIEFEEDIKDEVILELFSTLKTLADEKFKFKNMPWDSVERLFIIENDLQEKLIMIKTTIAEKSICQNNECPIFPEISSLSMEFATIDATNREQALNLYGTDQNPQYKDWERDYKRLLRRLSKLFSETYQLYAVSNAKRYEKHLSFSNVRVMLKEIVEAHQQNIGMETDVGDSIESWFEQEQIDAGLMQEGKRNQRRIAQLSKNLLRGLLNDKASKKEEKQQEKIGEQNKEKKK